MRGIRVKFLGFLMCMFVVCSGNAQKSEYKNKVYDAIFRPDSILTHEQKSLKIRLSYVLLQNMEVKGDTVVSTFTKRTFVRSRIPMYYYNKAKADVKSVNELLKNGGRSTGNSQKWIETMVKTLKEEQKNNIILLQEKK